MVGQVKVIGPVNLPATVPLHASEMYARNIWNLLNIMHQEGDFTLDWEDEILAGAVVTREGQVVHDAVKKALGDNT